MAQLLINFVEILVEYFGVILVVFDQPIYSKHLQQFIVIFLEGFLIIFLIILVMEYQQILLFILHFQDYIIVSYRLYLYFIIPRNIVIPDVYPFIV